MKKILILTMIMALSAQLSAQSGWVDGKERTYGQEKAVEEEARKFDTGFGFGLDYGGLAGIKMSLVPFRYVSVFGSLGYHIVDFGWQAGMCFYILPKTNINNIRPYIKAMYGTNRVIKVEGAPEYDKNYKGVSPGFGIEFRFGKTRSSGLNIDLNFPISSQEFEDDYEALENDPNIEITQNKLPVAFSIGYHFEL